MNECIPMPIEVKGRLLASLPENFDGSRLRRFREATRMTRQDFAYFTGLSVQWVKWFEDGNVQLAKSKSATQASIAFAAQRLGFRLTENGAERIDGDENGNTRRSTSKGDRIRGASAGEGAREPSPADL
jgi:transcriptional regulator with XRE-family HTH domain